MYSFYAWLNELVERLYTARTGKLPFATAGQSVRLLIRVDDAGLFCLGHLDVIRVRHLCVVFCCRSS